MKRSDLYNTVKYDRNGGSVMKIPGVGAKVLPDDPDMDLQTASPPLATRRNASGGDPPAMTEAAPKDDAKGAFGMDRVGAFGMNEVSSQNTHEPGGKDTEHEDVAPPGWEGTVKAMKDKPGIDNPWALAWHMANQGDTPHK